MYLQRLVVPASASCKHAAFGYTGVVPETAGAGFGDPNNVGGQPPIAAFFLCPSCLRTPLSMAGRVGQPSGWPVPTFRFANPTVWPATPRLATSGGLQQSTLEAAMPNTLARPEQTQIRSLIQKALRDAVAAPSDRDSLDIVGAALTAIAALANAALSRGEFDTSHRRNAKMAQLCALLDLIRIPAVREALEHAPTEVQKGICFLARDCQVEAFAEGV